MSWGLVQLSFSTIESRNIFTSFLTVRQIVIYLFCIHLCVLYYMCNYVVLFLQVTYKSYAGSHLLSGWTPHPAQQLTICKNAAVRNSTPPHATDLKGLYIIILHRHHHHPHFTSCQNISVTQTLFVGSNKWLCCPTSEMIQMFKKYHKNGHNCAK